MNWTLGVTTVPERRDGLLMKTLNSLRTGGFPQPRLFVDGLNPRERKLWGVLGLEVSDRWPRVGAAGNWWLALCELWVRNPQAARYAIFQDDLTCVKNLRAFLDGVKWPVGGYLNLYTCPHHDRYDRRYDQTPPPPSGLGWVKSNQYGRGALAYVFDRWTVQALLTSGYWWRHKLIPDEESPQLATRWIDGGVVKTLTDQGFTEWVHYPSLVQHRGSDDPMNTAPSYPGDDCDALTLGASALVTS